jgi:hypothetical protein
VITATCGGTGIDLYKRIRPEISEARPFWPLGLPAWEDAWLAHGLHGESSTYLAVWRRGPAGRNAAPGSGGGPSPGAWRCRDVPYLAVWRRGASRAQRCPGEWRWPFPGGVAVSGRPTRRAR